MTAFGVGCRLRPASRGLYRDGLHDWKQCEELPLWILTSDYITITLLKKINAHPFNFELISL